ARRRKACRRGAGARGARRLPRRSRLGGRGGSRRKLPIIAAQMPRYGPPDAFETPRFAGPRTFMLLPHVRDLDGVDVAVVGIPSDGAQVFRSGSRFGPEAIRSASVMLRNYNPILDVDV